MRRILVAVALAAIGLAPMPAAAQTAPECFGRTATVVGTEGDDTLSGTAGSDVIAALDGHDTVLGWHDPEATLPHVPALPDEMDYICGGAGGGNAGDPREHLWGGYGRDRIAGGSGAHLPKPRLDLRSDRATLHDLTAHLDPVAPPRSGTERVQAWLLSADIG